MSYQPKPPGSRGQILLGRLDYYFKPKIRRKQIGPFNGQQYRQQIFRELLDKLNFSLIAETGTFRGETTRYLYQESGLTVYSAEVNPRFYGYAGEYLKNNKDIRLWNIDSRSFLVEVIRDGLLDNQKVLFYLDAHWGEDLPLLEEIQIVFGRLNDAVIMIDDFEVPGDDAYGFDDYGAGKSLSLEYIKPAIREYGLAVFFPARPGKEESGARRGCVVLARNNGLSNALSSVASLRQYDVMEQMPA